MKISIFGLGYVGAVSCGCLAKDGHKVIGVDISKTKIDLINAGRSPIIESEIGNIIKQAISRGRLKAISDTEEAILNSEISFVCVGTPSKANGSLDLSHIEDVCIKIGQALNKKQKYHIVVVRSTVLPGTTRNVVIPLLEKYSKKKSGIEFGVCFNPEFMREGSSVYDYYNPPKVVIGSTDEKCSKALKKIYGKLQAEKIITSIEVSEMIKYADNSFHALKITFANEIGMFCKKHSIDAREVMNIFCKDTKLNISSNYLKPGFAFGGSCLPKDIRAILYKAKMEDVELPLLNSILESNEKQIENVTSRIIQTKKNNIGILGFSFKEGTDDLRESPMIEIIETLMGKGYKIKLYDKNVNLARLIGANKRYIEERIPHIARMMCENIDEVIRDSAVIVIGNKIDKFKNVLEKTGKDKIIIDLVGSEKNKISKGNYNGIAW